MLSMLDKSSRYYNYKTIVLLFIVTLFILTITGCVEEAAKVIIIPARAGGGGGCLVSIILVICFFSAIYDSFNKKAPVQIQQQENIPKIVDTNTYYGEKFKVYIRNAIIDGDKTVVNLSLINMANVKSKVLVSSGQSISNLGQKKFVASPFLKDEHGNEYMVEQPAIRGDIENYFFYVNNGSWGGKSTIKISLPPHASVSGQMIFPRLRAGSSIVTLTIPGIGGWQTDIVIPNISVTTENSIQDTSQDVNNELIRSSSEVDSSYVNEGVIVNHAGVAEELSDDGSLIGENTVFEGNGRYDRSRRDYVTYYAKFSGAVPERTQFKVKIFFNGSEDLYMHHCPATTAKNRTGIYTCRPGPYDLAPGNWEIRLFADNREVNRTQFEIVSGQ